MSNWLKESKLGKPKCLAYVLVGALQIVVAGEWSWPSVTLAGLLAWKTYISEPGE